MQLRTRAKIPETHEALFRDLYTRILPETGAHNILGVTSAIAGEGKTTVVLNLASTLADDLARSNPDNRSGQILIIDCNPAHDGVCRELGVQPTVGLVQYLRDEISLESAAHRTPLERLSVMPIGGAPVDFSVLIRTAAMRDLRRRLAGQFGLVVLDLPALLTTTDTQVLVELADAVLLVVRSGVTPGKLIRRGLEQVEAKKMVGMVLNDWRPDLPNWLRYRL